MPRRAAAQVRPLEADPIHRSKLVQQVINKVMLDGKKSIAERIVYEALALSPWLAVAVCASVIAFYASARGLQDSDAVPVIAVTGTAANIAGIAGGIVVFGDPMAGGVLGVTLQALAFVLVVVASALMPAPLRAARVAASA